MGALMDQLSHMSAAASPQQLAGAFASFIDQPGIPELRVRLLCDGNASAHVSQNPYGALGQRVVARQWRVPACFGVAEHEKYCRIVDRKAADVLLGATCPSALMPNDEGRGYFRFSVDAANRAALIKDIAARSPADQIAILLNLSAGLRAGEVGAADLLRAIKNVAPTARWDVLDVIDQILHALRVNSGLAGADLANYRHFVSEQFASRLLTAGYTSRHGEAPTAILARERLATLMVSEARDAEATAALAKTAQDIAVGASGHLPPELTGEAMRAGIMTGGAPFANALIKTFVSSNQEFLRRQLVYAFAASDDSAVVRSLLNLALGPRMRTGEIRYLFEYMSEEPTAAATLWNWYKTNFKALLVRLSRDGMRRAPSTLQFACDEPTRNDLDTFFAPKTGYLTGTARALSLAEQRISRCIAFRQAKASEIAASFRPATK
jgi:alanyl aminopeptidase